MSFLARAWAEIDVSAVVNNYKIVKEYTQKPVYAVVKANAYGHGVNIIAPALEKAGADGFAVSNIEEAEELRECGIVSPILILGYTPAQCVKRLAFGDFRQCVYSLDYAIALHQCAQEADVSLKVHLKIDTGMGRIGFHHRTGIEEMLKVLSMTQFTVEGIFTHFSCSDSNDLQDQDYFELQYNRFFKVKTLLEEHQGFPFPVVHCANSAACSTLQCDKGDAVRAGIILYGLEPSEDVGVLKGIRPVMSFYSVVSMVKSVEAGESISYGRTYKTKTKRVIATVSAGYADGVPRLLSNRGEVLIRGKRAPIVGRVCMDQFCVDVTEIPNVTMGDRVTIFDSELSVGEVARHAQTIHYEITCGISKRVARVYNQSV